MNELAPIIVFAYKRLDVLIQTIESLKANTLASNSLLYVFSDGPKNVTDTNKILNVREYLNNITGFKKVILHFHEHNIGLALNITTGISTVLNTHENVIVLEDDIITSPVFLEYMNESLLIYKDNDRVCQISGYSYLEKYSKNYSLPSFYFIKGADCLAWGTWKRAWFSFTLDSLSLANEIKQKKLIKNFNRDNSYNFYSMLLNNSSGLVKSWAINWYATNFLLNKYTLYPLKSYAVHIGANDEATNYIYKGKDDPLNVSICSYFENLYIIPVLESKNVTNAYNNFLLSYNNRIKHISMLKIYFLKFLNIFR